MGRKLESLGERMRGKRGTTGQYVKVPKTSARARPCEIWEAKTREENLVGLKKFVRTATRHGGGGGGGKGRGSSAAGLPKERGGKSRKIGRKEIRDFEKENR